MKLESAREVLQEWQGIVTSRALSRTGAPELEPDAKIHPDLVRRTVELLESGQFLAPEDVTVLNDASTELAGVLTWLEKHDPAIKRDEAARSVRFAKARIDEALSRGKSLEY